MSKDNIEKRVGFLLERTTRILKLSFTKAFGNLGVDITPEQWIILDTLVQKGSHSQVELAQIIFKNIPTVSRIIDILVNKDFVLREISEEDRRKTIISISEEGEKLVFKCYKEVKRLRTLAWDGLSNEDYEVFTRIINTVFENMKSY